MVIQAPMAGFTDRPMRRLAKEFGADLAYTEMISARALVEGHQRTVAMLNGIDREASVVVQLMGSDPGIMAEAAAAAESTGADGVDINLGCPVKKIVRSGAGAALMREPGRVREIVRRVRDAIRIPLSVKMRAGWDEASRNAMEIGRIAQASGVDAVAIHGRLATQGYAGGADWGVIRSLAESLTVPVVGNGDVRTCRGAEEMVRRTGCAAVMIGRASLGNPWIFRAIKLKRAGKEAPWPDAAKRIEVAERHLLLAFEEKGRRGLLQMRKHLAWYLRGFPGAREVRDRIHRTEAVSAVLAELEGIRKHLRSAEEVASGGRGDVLSASKEQTIRERRY